MLALLDVMYSLSKQAFVLSSVVAEQLHNRILEAGLSVSILWGEEYSPDDSSCDWFEAYLTVGDAEYVLNFHVSEFDSLYQDLLLAYQDRIELQLEELCVELDRFELTYA